MVRVALISIVGLLIWRAIFIRQLSGELSAGTINQDDVDMAETLDGLIAIAYLITACLFLRWLYVRVHEYEPVSTGPWWVWVIPVLNVIVLCLAVWNLYKKSGAQWSPTIMRPLLVVWAVLFFAGSLVARIASARPTSTIDQVRDAFDLFLVGDVVLIAAGITCLIVVSQVATLRATAQPLPALPARPFKQPPISETALGGSLAAHGPPTLVCPECGGRAEVGDRHCGRCGKPLTGTNTQ